MEKLQKHKIEKMESSQAKEQKEMVSSLKREQNKELSAFQQNQSHAHSELKRQGKTFDRKRIVMTMWHMACALKIRKFSGALPF